MLRAVISQSQGFNVNILPASSLIIIHSTQRFLSTSAAIRRGLRKSRPKARNAGSGYPYGENRSTTYSEGRNLSPVDRRHALPKERRPNHDHGLDVEDMISSERVDKRQTQRSNFPGGFGRRDGPSSFRKPDRETGDYRDTRKSSHDPSHGSSWDKRGSSWDKRGSSWDKRGSSWDKRSSFTSFKDKYASQDNLRMSRRYEARGLPSSEPSRRRDGAFREQLRAIGLHEDQLSPSSAPIRERQETSRSVRKPPTRAERRFALYGKGDTAPGGIPRSELHVEENGDILRPASKQLRMAAKRRQLGDFSEPGLADERDYISNTPSRRMRSGGHDSPSRIHEDPGRVKVDIPLSIPYSTPASEFLYGTSVISAALTATRRKMYKLYVYSGENREVGVTQNSIQDLARDRKVEVIKVDGDGLRMMDKLSAGRAHNGYILEASPLPKLPVTGLDAVSSRTQDSFRVCLDYQSAEEEAINGRDNQVHYKPIFSRYPFVLLLDGILDPGNLGAVLRTAFFLGVDAVAISSGHSAPLTPVALKASAGACEALPLLSVSNPFKFIDDARSKGWKTYAAVAPVGPNTGTHSGVVHPRWSPNRPFPTVGRCLYRSTTTLGHPIHEHPCILMLGSEGDGLRKALLKKSDVLLSIEGGRGELKSVVDSLNVSVAAGLLCETFLRPPSKGENDKAQVSGAEQAEQPDLSSPNPESLHSPNAAINPIEKITERPVAGITTSADSL